MKVKELIEVLSKHDPEAMAVVRGYEGGLDEVNHVSACKVLLNVNDQWYYGKHEDCDVKTIGKGKAKTMLAVKIAFDRLD